MTHGAAQDRFRRAAYGPARGAAQGPLCRSAHGPVPGPAQGPHRRVAHRPVGCAGGLAFMCPREDRRR
jgi:hypothetical protein